MDHALSMRGADRLRQGGPDLHDLVERQAFRWDERAQGRAVHEFRRQEEDVPVLLDAVHGDDAGVVDGGERPGFALEMVTPLRIAGDAPGLHLQRDLPLQPLVKGQVHLAHGATAEQGEDPVVTDGGADHGGSPRLPGWAHSSTH